MKYKVIASSSKGNAYLVHGEILIDVGVSYSKLTPYINKVEIILLTHDHGDHFKKDTIAKIAVMHPDILFVCGEWLKEPLIKLGVRKILVIAPDGKYRKIKDFLIYPIELFHGYRNRLVNNYGYRIILGSHKTIHMTDTGSYDGINAEDYNVIAIEANHCETLINERVEESKRNGVYEYGSLSRVYHASLQQAEDFIGMNANENTKVYLLHPSYKYLNKEQLEYVKKTQT